MRQNSGGPRVVAVVQARMNSSRLPGKILMPLAGAPLLQRLVERVRRSDRLDGLVIATTATPRDDGVEALCDRLGVSCFRGDEADVLKRVHGAAQSCAADVVVRLTGDNPLVDGGLVDYVVGAFLAAEPPVAYASNVDGCGFPYGLYVEVVSITALTETLSSSDPTDREHVTWHIRQNPGRFRILSVPAPGPFRYDALTVDTTDDYTRVGAIFEQHFNHNPDFGFRDLMVDHPGGGDAHAP